MTKFDSIRDHLDTIDYFLDNGSDYFDDAFNAIELIRDIMLRITDEELEDEFDD